MIDIDSVAPDVSVSYWDYWKYTPTKEQFKSKRYMQNGSYGAVRFFSRLGITNFRWKALVKKNKLEALGREREAKKLARFEK